MLAHIVVDNGTGHVIHAKGCGSLFALALGSNSHPAQVAWPACLQPLTIAIGESSYPETITASYDSCGGTASPPLPACPMGDRPRSPLGSTASCSSSPAISSQLPLPFRCESRPGNYIGRQLAARAGQWPAPITRPD